SRVARFVALNTRHHARFVSRSFGSAFVGERVTSGGTVRRCRTDMTSGIGCARAKRWPSFKHPVMRHPRRTATRSVRRAAMKNVQPQSVTSVDIEVLPADAVEAVVET